MLYTLVRLIAAFGLFLRYRISVKGIDEVRRKGRKGILFLPNHPALIDPVIISVVLGKYFRPRALVDEKQVRTTVLKYLKNVLRIFQLADLGVRGATGHDMVIQQINDCSQALKNGDNLLIYPAGRLYRSKQEKLRGNGGISRILEAYPDVRIVLVRTKGLWGSSFSRAKGYQGSFGEILKGHFKYVFANLIFFGPRRHVDIEVVDCPEDFPRTEGKDSINRYLENFYNQAMTPNTYVPYTHFERGGIRYLPEPDVINAADDTSQVPDKVKEKILAKLREVTGRSVINETDTLGTDLSMDSLLVSELQFWIQDEFGYEVESPDNLRTVTSLFLAAIGEGSSVEPLNPIPPNWFIPTDTTEMTTAPGEKVTDCFLYNAKKYADRPILADQNIGVVTYRQIVLVINAMKDIIAKLPGERIGIIMPATSISTIIYLTTLYAGKIPVLLNWTVGPRNLNHCIKSTGLQVILTSKQVVEKLEGKGSDFSDIKKLFVFLEDIKGQISLFAKLRAKFRSCFHFSALQKCQVPETAAIIFTSGSESLPKAVPLTHKNLLSDLRPAVKRTHLNQSDSVLGILPPFHVFGILMNVMMPCCCGMRVAFHANPTEGDLLARLIAAYKLTMAVATPTFVNGFLKNASEEQVSSLRIIITGAEKCSDQLMDLIKLRNPNIIMLEGYGITECGPIVSMNPIDNPKRGTVGPILECLEYVITDENMHDVVPQGQTGLLLVRGDNVCQGYLNSDAPSPFVTFQGKEWYRTGDLVSQDEDGFIIFQGRLKRFVKIAGEMISLPAIEEALCRFFSDPDPKHQGPSLAVEARGNDQDIEIMLFTTLTNLDRETVNQKLRENGFNSLSFIKRIVTLPEIPVLGSGKTDYRTLKDMANQLS